MKKRDYYEILGVERNASSDDIKIAYRGLAKKFHPDIAHNKKEAEIKFKEINEAYAVLGDSEKREKYNTYGHAGFEGSDFGFDFGFSDFGDLGGIFDMFFDFGGSGGGRSRSRQASRAQEGEDVRYDLEITMEESFKGVEVEINLPSFTECKSCGGHGYDKDSGVRQCSACEGTGQQRTVQRTPLGQIIRTHICSKCKGAGQLAEKMCKECKGESRVFKERKLKVNIPRGVDSDSRIRLAGQGHAGVYGGPSGDLYIFVKVKKHKIFKRVNNDIYLRQNISFSQAAMGAALKIETLHGEEKLHIQAGTQNGEILKLKGKGMPDVHSGRPGDQVVEIFVEVPKKLSDKQKKLLEEFEKEDRKILLF